MYRIITKEKLKTISYIMDHIDLFIDKHRALVIYKNIIKKDNSL